MTRTIVSIIVGLTAFFGLKYLFLPVVAGTEFIGFPFLISFSLAVVWLVGLTELFNGDKVNRVGVISGWTSAAVFLLFIIIIPFFTTSSLMNASSYQEIIGDIKQGEWTADINPIDLKNIVIIDSTTAERLADKKLTDENMALGSQVKIGDFTLQNINDKLYYVAPLLHSGFFKYLDNKKGTPGYMMVSAINEKDVKLVQNVGGVDIFLQYQPDAFWGRDLHRHIYSNGYSTTGIDDFSFELDDNGYPHWVVTLYDNTVGCSGSEAKGVLIIDPMGGEISEYSIEDTPKWVDRIQPISFIDNQLNDYGYYVHGWLNPSDLERTKLSQGSTLVYGEDGQCYFYSGVTSAGSDDASLGFYLVNTRTKEATFYKLGGAIENSARYSAEGMVQDLGYTGTFPRPYNINGTLTYILALKDNSGLIKQVAMVSYVNYSIVGIGDNLKEALRSYKSTLNSTGNELAPSESSAFFRLTSKIKRIAKDIKKGDTYYYILLDDTGYVNNAFVLTSYSSEEIVLSKPGDMVYVEFIDGGEEYIDISIFDNLNLNFQKTVEQKKIEVDFDKVENEAKLEKDVSDFDILVKENNVSEEVVDSLSEDQKSNILNELRKNK